MKERDLYQRGRSADLTDSNKRGWNHVGTGRSRRRVVNDPSEHEYAEIPDTKAGMAFVVRTALILVGSKAADSPVDDMRLESEIGGLHDWNYEPSAMRTQAYLERGSDHMRAIQRTAKELRPYRCEKCGFRWKTEDERQRCCLPLPEGGFLLRYKGGRRGGKLSDEERNAVLRLIGQGLTTRRITKMLKFYDYERRTSARGLYDYERVRTIKRNGWTRDQYTAWAAKQRKKHGHDR